MFVLCLLPVVELGLTFCEVEFAIAEMACVSRNVRTTRSESLPAFRSNGPFLSAMSHILLSSWLIFNCVLHDLLTFFARDCF